MNARAQSGVRMDEWGKWRKVLSPASVKVWNHLSRYGEQDATISELTRTLGLSKTAIRGALAELSEHGFLTVEVDDVNA